jgi:acyl-CoA thioesterase-2
VGDLEIDTALEYVGEGRYRATLSGEWQIWGPMGGDVAAVAVRAAGAESPFPLVASGGGQLLCRRLPPGS